MTLTVHVRGLRLPNFANQRMHWRQKAKLVAQQRETVTYELLAAPWTTLPCKPDENNPWRVVLTRIGPRELDDDGVVSSCKAARDAFAAFVGVDDKKRNVVAYAYAQEKSKEFGLRIEVTPKQLELKEGGT